ncbi:MAG: hypothetical protein CL908_10435 [Deltaproteobacteria bacterium]|nr:hypothetical protein [Deltaproteobacteria bacterium]
MLCGAGLFDRARAAGLDLDSRPFEGIVLLPAPDDTRHPPLHPRLSNRQSRLHGVESGWDRDLPIDSSGKTAMGSPCEC